MLVSPCGVSLRGVNHTKNRIGTDEVPGIDRSTAAIGVPRQTRGIDRVHVAIRQARPRSAAVEQELIDIDTLLILRGSAVGSKWSARACENAVSGSLRRRRE